MANRARYRRTRHRHRRRARPFAGMDDGSILKARLRNIQTGLKARGAPKATLEYIAKLPKETLTGSCAYCLETLLVKTFSIDHITPLSRGGSHDPDNLTVCCKRCNLAKGALSGEEYRRLLDTIRQFEDKGLSVLRRLVASGGIFRRFGR